MAHGSRLMGHASWPRGADLAVGPGGAPPGPVLGLARPQALGPGQPSLGHEQWAMGLEACAMNHE